MRRIAARWIAAALYAPVLAASAVEHRVEIRDFEYKPNKLQVRVGDTLRFINRDGVPHTVTASDRSWDSGLLASGKEWVLTVSGETQLALFCQYHPVMRAELLLLRPNAERPPRRGDAPAPRAR